MRERIKKVIITCAAFLLAGCAYALLCTFGFGLPCPFNLLTGLRCPGCGVTRMCLSLMRLDFKSAWHYNAAIMALLPLGIAVLADYTVSYVKTGSRKMKKWADCAVWFMIAVLLIFGVLRNII